MPHSADYTREQIESARDTHMVIRASGDALGAPRDDERIIPAIFASDRRTRVFDFERMEIIEEILFMDEPGPDPTRLIPFLVDHLAFLGPDGAIGSGRGMQIVSSDEQQLYRGDLYFMDGPTSSPEDRAWRLASGGHVTSVSIGYSPHTARMLEPGEELEFRGQTFQAGGLPLRLAPGWAPREISHVLAGADPTAVMERCRRNQPNVPTIIPMNPHPERINMATPTSRGEAFGGLLTAQIEEFVEANDVSTEDAQNVFGDAMGIDADTVSNLASGDIECPGRSPEEAEDRIAGAADVAPSATVEDFESAATADGCSVMEEEEEEEAAEGGEAAPANEDN